MSGPQPSADKASPDPTPALKHAGGAGRIPTPTKPATATTLSSSVNHGTSATASASISVGEDWHEKSAVASKEPQSKGKNTPLGTRWERGLKAREGSTVYNSDGREESQAKHTPLGQRFEKRIALQTAVDESHVKTLEITKRKDTPIGIKFERAMGIKVGMIPADSVQSHGMGGGVEPSTGKPQPAPSRARFEQRIAAEEAVSFDTGLETSENIPVFVPKATPVSKRIEKLQGPEGASHPFPPGHIENSGSAHVESKGTPMGARFERIMSVRDGMGRTQLEAADTKKSSEMPFSSLTAHEKIDEASNPFLDSKSSVEDLKSFARPGMTHSHIPVPVGVSKTTANDNAERSASIGSKPSTVLGTEPTTRDSSAVHLGLEQLGPSTQFSKRDMTPQTSMRMLSRLTPPVGSNQKPVPPPVSPFEKYMNQKYESVPNDPFSVQRPPSPGKSPSGSGALAANDVSYISEEMPPAHLDSTEWDADGSFIREGPSFLSNAEDSTAKESLQSHSQDSNWTPSNAESSTMALDGPGLAENAFLASVSDDTSGAIAKKDNEDMDESSIYSAINAGIEGVGKDKPVEAANPEELGNRFYLDFRKILKEAKQAVRDGNEKNEDDRLFEERLNMSAKQWGSVDAERKELKAQKIQLQDIIKESQKSLKSLKVNVHQAAQREKDLKKQVMLIEEECKIIQKKIDEKKLAIQKEQDARQRRNMWCLGGRTSLRAVLKFIGVLIVTLVLESLILYNFMKE
ncbi:hypothetical protein HK104_009481 [Borealophlyctis nickersoniae]|nr:hypothetical protein HK104_009481 [Borealophlyctis nickersoniae]